MAVFARTMMTRIARKKRTIAVPDTRSMGVLLFWDEEDGEAVDPLDATALPLHERHAVRITSGPPGAAQLGPSNLTGPDVGHGYGDVSDERVDGRIGHAKDAQ